MKKSILIIGITKAEQKTSFGSSEYLVERLQEFSDDTIEFAHFDDFSFHLYNNHKIINERSGRDLATYDLVFFRDWFKDNRDDLVLALSLYLDHKDVPYLNKEASLGRSRGKLSQHVLGCTYQVSMPKTFCGDRTALLRFIDSDDFFGYPCIVKASNTSRGRDNYLVKDEQQLIEAYDLMGGKLNLVQEYIPNSRDYRVLMHESKVLMVIERRRPENSTSHLNNTSQGAIAKKVSVHAVPESLMKQCAKISQRLGRTFTGVDVMQDERNDTFVCLEINNMPQTETGACVNDKLAITAELLHEVARS